MKHKRDIGNELLEAIASIKRGEGRRYGIKVPLEDMNISKRKEIDVKIVPSMQVED